MLIAILSGAVCLIISIILFTPMFRHFMILRPVALFFIFEGVWIFVDYLIARIYPGTEAMQWIHYAGIIDLTDRKNTGDDKDGLYIHSWIFSCGSISGVQGST